MKSVFGVILTTLSVLGLAHQNTVVKPPSVAVAFPKVIHLSVATPVVVVAPSPRRPKKGVAVYHPVTAGVVLGTSTIDGVVAQSQLRASIEQASNALRQLIYAHAGTIGQGQYSTGGYTNNLAISQRIDNLSNVTIANPTVTGNVSGLTAAGIPALSSLNGLLGITQGGTGTSTVPAANRQLLSDANGNWEYISTSTLGIVSGVSSVSNADGTLTITPTGGNVVASLNLVTDVAVAGQPAATGAPQLVVPRPIRVVLADPPHTEAVRTVLVHCAPSKSSVYVEHSRKFPNAG